MRRRRTLRKSAKHVRQGRGLATIVRPVDPKEARMLRRFAVLEDQDSHTMTIGPPYAARFSRLTQMRLRLTYGHTYR